MKSKIHKFLIASKQLLPMNFRTFIRYYLTRVKLLNKISKLPNWRLNYLGDKVYMADGFITSHDIPFLRNDKSVSAYEAALGDLEDFCVKSNSRYRQDSWESSREIIWRAHIVTWAAKTVEKLEGDFVECGVGNGLLSKTICHYLEFEKQDRNFYLLDCWELLRDENWGKKYPRDNTFSSWYEYVGARFSQFPNVKLMKGMIPDRLNGVKNIDQVAYLSLDMNDGEPEIAALRFFWPKLVPGAIVYFDDFLWGYPKLQEFVEEFLWDKDVELLHVPTGNSILIKNK